MSTVVWLLTSPRIPAGLLTVEAWDALRDARSVAASAVTPTVEAVRGAGVHVDLATDVEPLIAAGGVWIVGEDGDEDFRELLAERLAAGAIELEIVYGSWDPPGSRLLDLVAAVERLHDESGGCPWHREQTHQTLAPYLLEESYEVLDAIAAEDPDELAEELGDLLFQPVLHARLAAGRGEFDVDDVAGAVVDKIVRRHPHVWGAADPAGLYEHWNTAKAVEKPHRDHPADGVSRRLPALAFAAKVLDRFAAAERPIDVPSLPEGVAIEADEVGEFLFAAVAAATAAGVDPESALRRTVQEKAGIDPG